MSSTEIVKADPRIGAIKLQLEKGRIINELEREEEMVCILWVQSLFLKH